MKRLSISIMVLSLLFTPIVLHAQSTQGVHYQYALSDGGAIDFYFAEQGVRVDMDREDDEVGVIYRPDDDQMIVLQPEDKQATRLSRRQIKRSLKMMKTMRERLNKQLEQAPEGQREMMKKMMEERMPDFKNPENVPTPEITARQATEWNGMAAQSGVVSVDGDTRGTLIILNESPVTVSDPIRETMSSFQSFLEEMVKMGRATSQSGQVENALNRSELFVGFDQLKIAEVEREGRRLTLTTWEDRSIPNNQFEIPGDYEVNSPEIGPSMNGAEGSGQR